MSELKVDTITASDGTSPVTLTKQSAAKAWMNLNGTGTIAIRESFGVSSAADSNTGTYVLNMTNSMSDSDYVLHCPSNPAATNGSRRIGIAYGRRGSPYYVAPTSSAASGCWVANTGQDPDVDNINAQYSIHGDLA